MLSKTQKLIEQMSILRYIMDHLVYDDKNNNDGKKKKIKYTNK